MVLPDWQDGSAANARAGKPVLLTFLRRGDGKRCRPPRQPDNHFKRRAYPWICEASISSLA
ncbi:hypothetical protein RR42_m3477 [Cupriavidus basilensis]|uniref:Uncharacterized protein n=1 Tax=Cupriavidus basilensis TaxID=68895 RepID=A0A0C4YD66_9BURK|nr:hypothetical protein RR42_m3477 [Cupriavidus basilensis]